MRDYCFITGFVDFSGLCFPCRRYSMKIGVTFEGIAQPRDVDSNIARNILIANRSLFFFIIKLVMLSIAWCCERSIKYERVFANIFDR